MYNIIIYIYVYIYIASKCKQLISFLKTMIHKIHVYDTFQCNMAKFCVEDVIDIVCTDDMNESEDSDDDFDGYLDGREILGEDKLEDESEVCDTNDDMVEIVVNECDTNDVDEGDLMKECNMNDDVQLAVTNELEISEEQAMDMDRCIYDVESDTDEMDNEYSQTIDSSNSAAFTSPSSRLHLSTSSASYVTSSTNVLPTSSIHFTFF